MPNDIDIAITNLFEAIRKLQEVKRQKAYIINEMCEIRTLLLQTVRHNLDIYALGHAPDKRHY